MTQRERSLLGLVAHSARNWKEAFIPLKTLPITIFAQVLTQKRQDKVSLYLSEPHKEAAKLKMKSKSGATSYVESVIRDTTIGLVIRIMCNETRNIFSVLFNSAYSLTQARKLNSQFP